MAPTNDPLAPPAPNEALTSPVLPLDSNSGEVKTDPNLSNVTAVKALETVQQQGVSEQPVKNFTPTKELDSTLAPEATATREVVNQGPAEASLVKPNAKSLSNIEKYVKNAGIEIDIADQRDKVKDLVYKMTDLRNKGLDLGEEDRFKLDLATNELKNLNDSRAALKLNLGESAVSGDLVSMFRDIGASVVDSPVNAVVAASGLLGFFAGPAVGAVTTRVSTAAAAGKYNWERTYAQSYLDLDKMTGLNGEVIPHQTKDAIAKYSAYVQSTLEFGTDLLLAKTSKLFKVDKIESKLMDYALKNPGFKAKVLDFTKRAATQGFAASLSQVLQEDNGEFAKALGETWSKSEGVQIAKAIAQQAKNFDLGHTGEAAARGFITGAAHVGAADSAALLKKIPSAYDGAKNIYKKYTGKDVNLGAGNDVHVGEGPTSFKAKPAEATDTKIDYEQPDMSETLKQKMAGKSKAKFNLPATKDGPATTEVSTDVQPAPKAKAAPTAEPVEPKGFTIVDGVPQHLSPSDAVLLGEIIPNINNINKFNIAENSISKEALQTKLMEQNRVNKVYIDKEKLESWANNEDRKQEVSKLFLGDKGVYLDAQKVPLTPEEYSKLQSLGDVDALTDSTAITSTGSTIGDLKAKLKEMGTRKIPGADEIPSSDEIKTNPKMETDAEKQIGHGTDEKTAKVDKAIEGYEDFGLVTKNIHEQMTEGERQKFDELTTKTKEDMKKNFRDDVLDQYEKTIGVKERELNLQAEDKIVNDIMNDDKIVTVDSFMADKSLRIDPSTLPEDLQHYANDPLLEQRRVFKKEGGMHIDEAAAQLGVSPHELMDTLSNTPSTEQAYKTRIKIEQARNKTEATRNTDLNQEAITSTIDNKIALKKQALTNMIRKDPRAGVGLVYSVLKTGDKSSVDKVNFNAQEITNNTRTGDLSPKSYLDASRRHQNRANKASLKDFDLVQAAKETEKSIVADELHKAATVTKANVDKILDQVTRSSRNDNLKQKLEATGHLPAFESLTAMLGSRKMTEKDTNIIKDFLLTQQENGLEPDATLAPALQLPVSQAHEKGLPIDVNDLSLEQIKTVKSYIDAVVADSQNTIKTKIYNEKLFGAVVNEKFAQDAKANPNYDGSKSAVYGKGGSGWVKRYTDNILSVKRYAENLTETLDAFDYHKDDAMRLIVHQIQGTGAFDNGFGTKYKAETAIKIKNFMDDRMGPETIERLNSYAGKRVAVPEWANSEGLLAKDGTIKKTDLIGMLIVHGQEEGQNRLGKYGIDVQDIPNVLKYYLHKDDIKIAQAVWEAHDLLKEGIIVTEKTLKGRNDVEFVEGKPFTWHGEEVKGGYTHMTYTTEQKISTAAKWEMENLKQAIGDSTPINDNRAAAGFTKEGFKKARAENLDAYVDLDLNRMVHGSIGDIIANNTMLVPIYNAMKILNDPANAKETINIMGKNGFQVFKDNILRTGRNTDVEMSQSWKLLDEKIIRPLEKIGNNFMLSKIIGSVSSIASQTVSVANLGIMNVTRPKILFDTGMAYMKMLANPGSVHEFIDVMGEKIPSIKTDRSSYQVKDINNFKLFNASESEFAPKRFLVNATNGFTDVWLTKMMGGMDELAKTGHAVALMNSYLSGKDKRGPTLEQLNKMTESERSNKMGAFVNDELKKIFPDRDETSISYIQRHPIGKLFAPFFNDARIALNYIVFNRIEDVVHGVTQFPARAAKDGVTKAIAKSGTDIITNALMLQVHLSVIDSMTRSFRGEDKDGDKTTNKNWLRRWAEIFKKDVLDPWNVVKSTAELTPVASSVKFFMDSDGRAGGLKTPALNWADSVYKTMNNLKDVGFNPTQFDDKEYRDAVNSLSGLSPLPTSVLNNYVFGESTSFQTGVKGIAAAVMSPVAVAKSLNDMVETNIGKLDVTKAGAEQDVLKGTIEGQLQTLMDTPQGRATVKSSILSNKYEIMSPEQLNDIIFAESNGVPDAENPYSSAKGIGQFLTKTWNEQIKDLDGFDKAYNGEPPAGKIDGRTDPIQSMQVLREFHKDIGVYLVDKGIVPDQENIYIGHHFGKYVAPAIIKSDDDRLLRDAYVAGFSDHHTGIKNWNNVTDQNPWVKSRMTVGEFKAGIVKKLNKGTEDRFTWEENHGKEFDPTSL